MTLANVLDTSLTGTDDRAARETPVPSEFGRGEFLVGSHRASWRQPNSAKALDRLVWEKQLRHPSCQLEDLFQLVAA